MSNLLRVASTTFRVCAIRNVILLFEVLIFLQAYYWRVTPNHRKFFEDFANINNFDPLVPENWYSISSEQLTSLPVRLMSNY